ncbi:hypothetical protein AKO1_007886 [Acrasis kona]|uniref:Far11/STRP C-terminal domain-containing protein n=1 Tax=Acrasis kona TaxID=1008807 RepID=A0AAW2YQE9_9EUKA
MLSHKHITPPLGLLFQNLYSKTDLQKKVLPEKVRRKFGELPSSPQIDKEDAKQSYQHNNYGHSNLYEACNEFLNEYELQEIQKSKQAFEALIQSGDYGISTSFRGCDHQECEAFVEDCLERVERNSNSDAGYCLLYIVLGCYGAVQGDDFSSKNRSQMDNMKSNCKLLLDCNALPTIYNAFQRHAFAVIDGKTKDSRLVNLYSNILYIFLTTVMWKWEERATIEQVNDVRYDLFGNEKTHMTRVLVLLLKESIVTNTNPYMPLNKIILLLWKSLYILLGAPHSSNESFVVSSDMTLKESRNKNTDPESKTPRNTIKDACESEKLYRLLLPDMMNLIASLLLVMTSDQDARKREISLKGACSILFYLIKHFKKSHPSQGHFVCQLLIEANAPVLFMRVLSVDVSKYLKAESDDPTICLMRGEQYQVLDEKNYECNNDITWRNAFTILTFLRLLQKINKDCEDTVLKLIQQKAHQVLYRMFAFTDCRLIVMYCAKIFKSMWKNIPPKWQSSHLNVLNYVYKYVKPLMVDGWLSNQQSNNQHKRQCQDVAKGVQLNLQEFNRFNYEQWWRSCKEDEDGMVVIPDENFVPIQQTMLMYGRTQISVSSTNQYEQMLNHLLATSDDIMWM